MSDLALAQNHAFHLARILMVPVTLFRSGDELGIAPSEEIGTDDDIEIIHEFDPHEFVPAH